MFSRIKEWGIPLAACVLALLLSLAAGPSSRALAFRAQADSSGGCCHLMKTVNVQGHGLFTNNFRAKKNPKSLFVIRMEVTVNGAITLRGLVEEGSLSLGPVHLVPDYEMALKDGASNSCTHTASAGRLIGAQFSDSLVPKRGITLGKEGGALLKIVASVATDFSTDLSENKNTPLAKGDEVKNEAGKLLDLDLKIESDTGKDHGLPKIEFGAGTEVTFVNGYKNQDIDTKTFLQDKQFFRRATLESTTHVEVSLDVSHDFQRASGQGSVSLSPPFLTDSDEPNVTIAFQSLNSFLIGRDCDGSPKLMDLSAIDAGTTNKLKDSFHFHAEKP